MINFLEETFEAICESGHEIDDISHCYDIENGIPVRFNWSSFHEVANFEYDETDSRGGISANLEIIFTDHSQLMRGYDLVQCIWVYKTSNGVLMPEGFQPKLKVE